MLVSFFLISKVFTVVAGMFCLGLGFWVYLTNPKAKINYLFFWTALFLFLWITACYIGNSVFIGHDPFWGRIAYGMVALFFIPFYFFSTSFLNEEKKFPILNFLLIFSSLFLFFISIFTNLMVKKMEITEYGAVPILGDGKYIYFLLILFWFLFIAFRFLSNYFRSGEYEKNKLRYFLIGFFIWVSMNVVFNIILPVFQKIPEYWAIGNYSAIVFLSFTAYAITKHELMGIKTFLTQVLIIIISLILLLDVVLLSDNLTMQLLKIGILLALLYFSRGMVESVKSEKKAREELEKTYEKINIYIKRLKKININLKEKNEDLGALLKISDVATGTLNSRKIAQNIMDSIPTNLKHLGYEGGVLVLYDREKEMAYTYALTESEIARKARKLLSKSLVEYAEDVNKVDNLVIKTIKERRMQIGDKLEDFIAPTVNKKICKLIQKMVKAKSFFSIPVFSGGRVIGAIIFVGTKPESEITRRNKDILFGFSSHIGAAIENAQLYEKTEKQIKALSILNENLKMANVRLKELMEIKNEFLHFTSHQLRTPLTTIRGMISMWYSGDFDDLPEKEKRKMLKRIYISSERLNNITNDMLDSLELEGGAMKFQFRQVSLREIVEETVDIMRPNFDERNLYLKFNDSANIPKVELEPNYIRQVFMNTIDNACKYTREGGVDIDIKKSGKYVEVIVKDTGIGVSESDQRKIFLKFTRGRRASIENASGSGLGLFIARKIVGAHNGKIEFFSEGSGKGSVVKIFLPIKQEQGKI